MSLFYYNSSAAVAAASPVRLPCPPPTAIPGATGVLSSAGVHFMQSPVAAATGVQWIPAAGLCGSAPFHYMLQPYRAAPVDKNGATATAITGLRVPLLTRINRSVRCSECNITLNSPQQAKQHYNGKSHQRRLQKLQQLQQQKQQQDNDSAQQTVTSSTVDEASNCSSVDDCSGTENSRKRRSSGTSSSPPPTKSRCSDEGNKADVTSDEINGRVDDVQHECETTADATSGKGSEVIALSHNKPDYKPPDDVTSGDDAENDVIDDRIDRWQSASSTTASLVRPPTSNVSTSGSVKLTGNGLSVRYNCPLFGIIRPTVAPSLPTAVIETYQLNLMNQLASTGASLNLGLGAETLLPVSLPIVRDFANGPATTAVPLIPSFNDVTSARLSNFPAGNVCPAPASNGLPAHGIVGMSVLTEFNASGQQTIALNVNRTMQCQNSPMSTVELLDHSRTSRNESKGADWTGDVQSALKFGDAWTKLDPVSKAVYENFFGQMKGPKSSKQWRPQRNNGTSVHATKR